MVLGRLEASLPTLFASRADDSGIVAETLRPADGLSWGVVPDEVVVVRGPDVRVAEGAAT